MAEPSEPLANETALAPVQWRAALLQPGSEVVSRVWGTWFEALWRRSGGATAPDNASVGAALEEISSTLDDVETQLDDHTTQLDAQTDVLDDLKVDVDEHTAFLAPITPFAQSLLDDPDQAAMQTTLGLPVTTGTFPAVATGLTTAVTVTALYYTLGPLVVLFLPTMTGISNATTMTITGLPAALQPTRTALTMVNVIDNGLSKPGFVRMNAGSLVLTAVVIGAPWITSGVKGTVNAWLLYARL